MGNRSVAITVVLGGLLVSAGLAQTPAALEAHFEGTHVQVKMDMPGDNDGVDVWPHREIPVDFTRVGNRLRRFGVALRRGDSVMVTKIRVKKKLIEFHLGGGGYTGGAGAPYISTNVRKSSREKELDDLIKKKKPTSAGKTGSRPSIATSAMSAAAKKLTSVPKRPRLKRLPNNVSGSCEPPAARGSISASAGRCRVSS